MFGILYSWFIGQGGSKISCKNPNIAKLETFHYLCRSSTLSSSSSTKGLCQHEICWCPQGWIHLRFSERPSFLPLLTHHRADNYPKSDCLGVHFKWASSPTKSTLQKGHFLFVASLCDCGQLLAESRLQLVAGWLHADNLPRFTSRIVAHKN